VAAGLRAIVVNFRQPCDSGQRLRSRMLLAMQIAGLTLKPARHPGSCMSSANRCDVCHLLHMTGSSALHARRLRRFRRAFGRKVARQSAPQHRSNVLVRTCLLTRSRTCSCCERMQAADAPSAPSQSLPVEPCSTYLEKPSMLLTGPRLRGG
jgi:hypothetical protein